MLNDELNHLADNRRIVADSAGKLPDALSKQAAESSGNAPDAGPDKSPVLAQDVPVRLGIGPCPKCRGNLVEETNRAGSAWHVCEHQRPTSGRKACDYRIFCRNTDSCVLRRVVAEPLLPPCRFGHSGAWALLERRGRCYLLRCCGPGQGHQVMCGQVFRHWRGAKPQFEHRASDNPSGFTLFCVLRAMLRLEPSATVGQVAAASGLSNRKARACLKRISQSATRFVREIEEKTYDPRSKRYIIQYELTTEGRIQAQWETTYGVYAEAESRSDITPPPNPLARADQEIPE